MIAPLESSLVMLLPPKTDDRPITKERRKIEGTATTLPADPRKQFDRMAWYLERSFSDTSVVDADNREAAAEQMMERAIDSPSKTLNPILRWLRERTTPQVVLNVALRLYRETGREQFLVLASSLLEHFGKSAWPTLRHLARSGNPDCEILVGVVARCKGISIADRLGAVVDFCRNPNPSVRARLFDYLDEFPVPERRELLHKLAKDADPEVNSQACEYLAVIAD